MPKSLFPRATPETRQRLEQDPTLKLFNDFDWASTPLGIIPDWPESLKGAVRVMMVATTPMAMLVGPEGILLYNNRYAIFAGGRHPEIFAKPAVDAWPEVADFNRANIERGMRGEGITLLSQELELNRNGHFETLWLDLHYSPILDEAGQPLGSVCVVNEVTDRVMGERALARSEERLSLALSGSALVGTWDWDVASDTVTSDDRFAHLFNLDPLRAGLGMPLQDFLRAVHPEDVQRVGEEIATALRTGTEYHSEYRLLAPDGDVRWVVASGRVRFGADGKPQRFPGIVVDVTEQKRITEALAESELRFRTLADTMPQMVWSTRADGYHDYYNARWYEFTGTTPGSTDGEGWNDVFHPDDQDRAWQLWRQSLATGEPYQIEYRLRHHSGEYRWTLGRALPIRDANGHIVRWFGTCTDIHESRQIAEERELVAQELSHRIKNIFAVLTGIIGLSARSRPEIKPFADELRQRIYALGEAHDFVRPHSDQSRHSVQQGSLRALVGRLLEPYRAGDAERVEFRGDDAEIDDGAATPLALLVHELGTNSAKYGALSLDTGRVIITGRVGEGSYHLEWQEKDGPQVAEPHESKGFGSRLINLSVEGQMRGTVRRIWKPEGLIVEIDIPLASMRRQARLQSMSAD